MWSDLLTEKFYAVRKLHHLPEEEEEEEEEALQEQINPPSLFTQMC